MKDVAPCQFGASSCGAIAGTVGCALTHPLDSIRIRMQTGGTVWFSGPVANTSQVAHWTDMRLLLRGAAVPAMTAGLRSSCIFFGYDTSMHALASSQWCSHVIAGAAGGFIAVPVTNCSELIKCRSQLYRGSLANVDIFEAERRTVKTLLARDGVKGFACGWQLTAMRDVLMRSVYFPTADLVACTLRSGCLCSNGNEMGIQSMASLLSQPHIANFIAGGTAGALSWPLAYPIDVVKTHWQTERRFDAISMTGLLKTGLRREGAQWLIRGLTITLLRSWSMNAVVFSCYQALRASL